MAGEEEKLLQKICSPYEIIKRIPIAPSPFPFEQHMLPRTTDELAKDFSKSSSCSYESLSTKKLTFKMNINDESLLQ